MKEETIIRTIAIVITIAIFTALTIAIIAIIYNITSKIIKKIRKKDVPQEQNTRINTQETRYDQILQRSMQGMAPINTQQTTDYPGYYPYRKKYLLSKAEYTFYNILKRKCDENQLIICPKVRMEDFLEVTERQQKLKYRGYIRSRHIDFMICDQNLHLIAGIELDDNTHQRPDIAETDHFKNMVFATIGLPLFRIKVSQGIHYEQQIRQIISTLRQSNQNPPAQ